LGWDSATETVFGGRDQTKQVTFERKIGIEEKRNV
jgi:hypothetical protein